MSCQKYPMYISSVGSFSVYYGGCLTLFFQFLGNRKLALNRESYILGIGRYIGGLEDHWSILISVCTTDPKGQIQDVVGLVTVSQQQPQSQMPSQAYDSYVTGPQWVFFFRVGSPTDFLMMVSVIVFAIAFRFQYGHHVHQWGAHSLGFSQQEPFGVYPWQTYVTPVLVYCPHQECTKHLLSPLLWRRGASCYLVSCPLAI